MIAYRHFFHLHGTTWDVIGCSHILELVMQTTKMPHNIPIMLQQDTITEIVVYCSMKSKWVVSHSRFIGRGVTLVIPLEKFLWMCGESASRWLLSIYVVLTLPLYLLYLFLDYSLLHVWKAGLATGMKWFSCPLEWPCSNFILSGLATFSALMSQGELVMVLWWAGVRICNGIWDTTRFRGWAPE